jgi:DNA-directed RNA polymerase specialized sigma24 family protein
MRQVLLVLVAAAVGGCGIPSGSGSSEPLGAAAADTQFDSCISTLMAGPEARVRSTVQLQFRLSPDDAHDLVRDALVSVCVQFAERGYTNIEATLQRAANNRATDNWRRKRRYPQCSVDDNVPVCDATDVGLRFDQEERAVAAAMCRLDRVSETIVRRRITDDVPFAEIGRDVGLSADEARTKYNNAIRKLRRELDVACPVPGPKNRPTSYTN